MSYYSLLHLSMSIVKLRCNIFCMLKSILSSIELWDMSYAYTCNFSIHLFLSFLVKCFGFNSHKKTSILVKRAFQTYFFGKKNN